MLMIKLLVLFLLVELGPARRFVGGCSLSEEVDRRAPQQGARRVGVVQLVAATGSFGLLDLIVDLTEVVARRVL
jgi:hypothetical protein